MLLMEVSSLVCCCGLGNFTAKAPENGKSKIIKNMADNKKGRFVMPEEIDEF